MVHPLRQHHLIMSLLASVCFDNMYIHVRMPCMIFLQSCGQQSRGSSLLYTVYDGVGPPCSRSSEQCREPSMGLQGSSPAVARVRRSSSGAGTRRLHGTTWCGSAEGASLHSAQSACMPQREPPPCEERTMRVKQRL
jgi:hypothetical protein